MFPMPKTLGLLHGRVFLPSRPQKNKQLKKGITEPHNIATPYADALFKGLSSRVIRHWWVMSGLAMCGYHYLVYCFRLAAKLSLVWRIPGPSGIQLRPGTLHCTFRTWALKACSLQHSNNGLRYALRCKSQGCSVNTTSFPHVNPAIGFWNV